MGENSKVIAERLLSLPEDERQRLLYLINQLERSLRTARSKKKRNRVLGDITAVLNEFCLDIEAVK